jgi:membrane protein implicated in regulation of membrane protease activity
MQHPINWILIVVGAILVLLEVLLGALSGFDLLLLGCAILLGGVAGVLSGTPIVGVSVATILSLFYVIVGRRKIHRKRPVAHFPFQRK